MCRPYSSAAQKRGLLSSLVSLKISSGKCWSEVWKSLFFSDHDHQDFNDVCNRLLQLSKPSQYGSSRSDVGVCSQQSLMLHHYVLAVDLSFQQISYFPDRMLEEISPRSRPCSCRTICNKWKPFNPNSPQEAVSFMQSVVEYRERVENQPCHTITCHNCSICTREKLHERFCHSGSRTSGHGRLHMPWVSTINSNISPKEVFISQDTAGSVHHQSCNPASLTCLTVHRNTNLKLPCEAITAWALLASWAIRKARNGFHWDT